MFVRTPDDEKETGVQSSATLRLSVSLQAQRAVEFANRTCFIGAGNKQNDIVKTHGYVDYLISRSCEKGFFSKNKFSYLWGLGRTFLFGKGNALNSRFDPVSKHFVSSHNRWRFVLKAGDDYSTQHIYLKTRDPKQDPLGDPQFNVNQGRRMLLFVSLLAKNIYAGNCQNRSCLVIKYLWEHGQNIQRLELVNTKTFDHVFVLINREGDNLHDSSTWGDAWIADPWTGEHGVIYHARDFQREIKKVKEYMCKERLALKKIGCNMDPVVEGEIETLDQVKAEVDLSRHRYPTYQLQPLKPLEDYYEVDLLPSTITQNMLKADSDAHRQRFAAVLSELRGESIAEEKMLDNMRCRIA